MTLLKRKRVLAAKVETTSGTFISLAAGDGAFNAYNIMIQHEIEVEQREGAGTSFGMIKSVMGGYKGKVTFTLDCSWSGTGTPGWATVFLTSCGWTLEDGIFSPETITADVPTLSIGVYEDGLLKTLAGCAGTFKFVCPTGKTAYIEFEFTGKWRPPVDAVMIQPTYPTDLPLRYAVSTTTYNSVALCLENITFDAGNEVIMRECATDVSGFVAAAIVDRIPKITGNPESKLVATRDSYGGFLASTEAALVWNLDGPTTSTVAFSAPKAQIINIQEGDRNKLVTDEIEWQCNRAGPATGDDDKEFTITFAPAV